LLRQLGSHILWWVISRHQQSSAIGDKQATSAKTHAAGAKKLGGWEVGIVALTDNRDECAELDRPLSTDLVGGVTCEERAD
jgi:hypothetical protein